MIRLYFGALDELHLLHPRDVLVGGSGGWLVDLGWWWKEKAEILARDIVEITQWRYYSFDHPRGSHL